VKQDSIIKMVVVLTVICIVAAFGLANVYNMTKEPIEQQKRLEMIKAIKSVLPTATVNDPLKDKVVLGNRDIYVGKDQSGKFTGIALKSSSPAGYSGAIDIMVGVNSANDSVFKVVILSMTETPGLGAKISETKFLKQFDGKNMNNSKWKVKKDGGDIDQIAGATISPRAVTSAVYQALKFYTENKSKILTN